ncbi:FYN-binding protein 2 isoform X5 [Strigops habroptila]|uniref:FYN-binding protein 2 isoform X5 n=1 Tax=Strigops habroptila TaxID=2489341 RepID=UPI0011CF1058|nr:FYN-binding protein 2 isoform X5 [Strigops habroptila]
MDAEGATDFRALRAKFQNDSNVANKLAQPCKKPPPEVAPKPGSAGNAVPSPLPRSKREEVILKPKDEAAHPAFQASVLTQCNPLAWPRAKLGYMKPTGHKEDHKGNISEKGLSSPKNGPGKPLLSCCTDQQGSAQTAPESLSLPNSFHHALQIWENTLSHSEKANAMLPTQRASNLYVHPCPEQRATHAPAASHSSRIQLSGSKPVLDLLAQKKDGLLSSGQALPQAPRRHRTSDEADAETSVASEFCQPRYHVPGEQPQHQKESEPPFCQPRAGKWSHSPGNKWPRIKPLPSAESLGPAPGKPARPPKFDLSAFRSAMPLVHRGNETTADEEDYLTPESPGRAIIEDEKEGKASFEREEQEAKKIFKTSGNEYVSPTNRTKEDGGSGMKAPQVKQDVSSTQTAKHPTPQGLAKDGAELLRYVYLGAPKLGVETTALDQNYWQSLQTSEDIYDDVEEMQDRLSHGSDASSPFTSASVSGNSYEEAYEDVEIGGDNPAKVELFSISVPNLGAVSQEDTVYDDVEVGQREPREKDDKYKPWMPKFLMAKEDKDQRKSSNDVERNIFKVKKNSAEKSKKMGKEEKSFRETFMYDKEISVISTATAECSVPSQRRIDLPVTAGEQLDVIDVTEGNAVICRNSEGRYGYVLVEHLNFRYC